MLTAKLILDRFDKEGRLVETREQPSRSFTKGFLELLYLCHAQIAEGSPYYVDNIDLESVPLEGAGSGTVGDRGYFPRLIIGAPPGLCSLSYMPRFSYENKALLLGVDVGIQVGVGTTAVTPTDRRLDQRIGHGRRAPDGAAVVFEGYTTGDTGEESIYGNRWKAQPFIPAVSHRISSVRVKIFKAGSPGDLTVEIRPVDPLTYDPGATVLATGTILEAAIPPASPGDWVECTFGTPIDLYAGHRYYIILRGVGPNTDNDIMWRYDTNATYQRAYDPAFSNRWTEILTSADAGSTWSHIPGDCYMFEDKGQSVGDFEAGGCELLNINFSDPNGEFTIRRYFTNNCGQSITVNEAGIVSTGNDESENRVWPILIARDLVAPGVAVADGEILRATYVPQITV